MPESSELLNDIVLYQKSLDRYSESRNDTKMLHCIFKLFNMPVTKLHLEKTGIGRTVNSLRKLGGEVGDAANTLVKKWKDMVSKKSDSDDSEQNVNEPDSTYESQNSTRENNSSHRNNDKSKTSDGKEKSRKEEKYKNDKREKYNEYKHQSTSDTRHKQKKRDTVSRERSICDSDDVDSESGVALDSDNSSSDGENIHSPVHYKHSKYEKDRKYENKHTKHKESSSEGNSKHKSDSEKNRKLERSHSKEKRSHDSHSSNERKRKRHHSSSSDSSEHVNKLSSSSSSKVSSKRKHDGSLTDEETKTKVLKKSSSHSSSKDSTRHEYKKENRSESDNEMSSHDAHKSTKHKSRESSSREYKKENKSVDEKKEKSSSKKDLKSERKKENSSREEHSKSSDRNRKEDDTSKDKKSSSRDKSKSKSTSKSSTSSTSNSSNSRKLVDIGSASGTSFAEALGMLEPSTSKVSSKKSKTSELSYKSEKTVPEKSVKEKSLSEKIPRNEKLDIVIPPPPKNDIELNISSLLPPITPNYRPVANPFLDNCNSRGRIMNDDEALSLVMSQKNQRTKVFSGNKCFFGTVPTLFELCIRILQDNIDALEYTGGVPYVILKPVLDKATPDQLFMLEHHNPYLIEDSDEIWHFHCQKEFRNKKREELESWREMYMRCLDEREAKLKALTENIKLAQDKSIPVRQTKLAYVDSVVKPPREVIRRQVKSGIDKKPVVTPSSRLNALATAGTANQVSVPNPVKPSSSGGSSAAMKPKKAPLMQKTLAFLKGNRFRR